VLRITNLIRWNRVGVLAASAVLLAACNAGGGSTQAPATQAASHAPASAGASAGASGAAEAYEVELSDNATYGKILTGEDGKTLYLFTPDSATTSACNTGCIDSWPAFTLEPDETVKGGDGVTGAFTTLKRQDGAMQVVYAGHPLYYFSGDTAAGDTKGEGLKDKWYLVGADGSAIMGAQSSGGKGYGY
jgi:predicted lipoprotein with Yx(FWY)xxD motif